MARAGECAPRLSEACCALEFVFLPLRALVCWRDVLDQVRQFWQGSAFDGELAQFLLVSHKSICESTMSAREPVI